MSHTPLVSIIIPTFNRAHLIGETLTSVLNQNYKNWECIVVDDGSSDFTKDLLESFQKKNKRISFYNRPDDRQKGANACRNYGFQFSKGKYIIFLDSDDILCETALLNRVKNIELTDCDLLINNSMAFEKRVGDLDIIWNTMESASTNIDLIIRYLNIDMPWSTNSVTWERNFFNSISGWNENLSAWQDWEIHCRALFLNPKIYYVKGMPDNYFRQGNHFSIGNSFKNKEYILSLYNITLKTDTLIKENFISNDKLLKAFKYFAYINLIKIPVDNRLFNIPFKVLFRKDFIIGVKRLQYFKIYLVELICVSFKMRKYVLKTIYLNQQEIYKRKSTHLKFKLKDI